MEKGVGKKTLTKLRDFVKPQVGAAEKGARGAGQGTTQAGHTIGKGGVIQKKKNDIDPETNELAAPISGQGAKIRSDEVEGPKKATDAPPRSSRGQKKSTEEKSQLQGL